jgi:hypothetical protein
MADEKAPPNSTNALLAQILSVSQDALIVAWQWKVTDSSSVHISSY